MVKKWEYKLEHWQPPVWADTYIPGVEKQLNTRGKEGWELLKLEWIDPDGGVSCRLLFKRPVDDES